MPSTARRPLAFNKDPLLSTVYIHIVRLFRDQNDQCHVATRYNGHSVVYDLPSKSFERWVRRVLMQSSRNTHVPADIERVASHIEAMAEDPATITQHYFSRIGQHEKTLYYDLGGNDCRTVEISSNMVAVVDNKDFHICFSPAMPQVEPDLTVLPRQLPELLQQHFRLKNPGNLVLLIAYLTTAFIHNINHPLFLLYGAAGSSKSTAAEQFGQIIDPQRGSSRLTLNPDRKAMIAALSSRYFLNFDNLDCSLRKWQSDILCNACTGGSEPMRRLYETNSLYTAPIKGVVCLNGLTVVANEADLLDRAILLELQRIDEESYLPEEELRLRFAAALPAILGAIFNTLHEALKLERITTCYPTARMQDFAKYAYLCCEAIQPGYGETFTQQYQANRELARNEARPPLIVECVYSFMQDMTDWSGTMTQLKEFLWIVAKRKGYRQLEFPQSASSLSRQLNYNRQALKTLGITYIQQEGGQRRLEITNSQYTPQLFV